MSFPHAGASSLRVGAHSQPRTPTSGHLAMIHQNVHSAPGEVIFVALAEALSLLKWTTSGDYNSVPF